MGTFNNSVSCNIESSQLFCFCVSGLYSPQFSLFLTRLWKLFTNSDKRFHIKWNLPEASFLCNLLHNHLLFSHTKLSSVTLSPLLSLPALPQTLFFHLFPLPHLIPVLQCVSVCTHMLNLQRCMCSSGLLSHDNKLTSSFIVQSTRLLHFHLFVSLHTCAHMRMCVLHTCYLLIFPPKHTHT